MIDKKDVLDNVNEKIIVRYPPSPTGIAHIGNIRSFLFSYLVKKKANGDAVLRFEDTDKERSDVKYENYIIESLNDLGIEYDRGPFRQSDRLEFYIDAIDTLIKNGHAYEAEESKDGSGDKVIRFKNPDKKITFFDQIRGEITIDSTDFGDFIIARSKTNPLYHLTVVVDDIDMGITDVIRGEDHITSTPRQILLIEALGGNIPRYAHLPLIVGKDGKKLGKRHGAVTWQEFKKDGYLPEAVVNYLALLGWHPKKGEEREIFSLEELVEKFNIKDVSKSPAKFDYDKLKDINKTWMLKLNHEEYTDKVLKFIPEWTVKKFNTKPIMAYNIIFSVIRERITHFGELIQMDKDGEFDYFFDAPEITDEQIIFKDGTAEESKKYIKEIIKKILNISIPRWNADNIKEVLWDWSGEVGRGKVLHPMRITLSGAQRSPDPFLLAEILGKEETIKRLEKIINQ